MQALLLENGLVLSQDSKRSVGVRDILVVDGKIAELGSTVPGPLRRVNLDGLIVLPALVNAHLHTGETIFRGRADGRDLFSYLEMSHGSYLAAPWAAREAEIHAASSAAALVECVRCGVGTVAISRAWKQVTRIGVRGFCGYPLIRVEKLAKFWSAFDPDARLEPEQRNGRVRTGLFVQSLMSSTRQMLRLVKMRLDKNGDERLFIHVAETREEIQWVKRHYGRTPVEVLDDLGLLTSRTICVHCVHLQRSDIDLIRSRGAKVVLCPTANLKLKSGLPDVDGLVAAGIEPAIATDGLATNNSASLLEAAKIANLCAGRGWLSAQEVLDMITLYPARVLGMGDRIGSIEVGKEADLAIFKVWPTARLTADAMPAHLVFNPAAFSCVSLLVAGRFIMRNGRVLTINEREVAEELDRLCRRLHRGPNPGVQEPSPQGRRRRGTGRETLSRDRRRLDTPGDRPRERGCGVGINVGQKRLATAKRLGRRDATSEPNPRYKPYRRSTKAPRTASPRLRPRQAWWR